jgi:signal transduction histidine kinase
MDNPQDSKLSIEINRLTQLLEQKNRELEVETALEKVRARTMAMQRSNELQDAATVMVQQIQSLGVPQFASGFNIWHEDKKSATAWMCNATTENLPPPFKTSSAEDIFLRIHDAAQRGESLFVEEQAGEELHAHYRYMNSIPIFREYVQSVSPQGFKLPDFQIMHCAFFLQGYLMFITYKPVPEAHEIFKRFAKVFEQTYTRFLDLKRAEEQAREAEIQLALERVRARTMAMQKSEELPETAELLFKQFKELGEKMMQMTIAIVNQEEKILEFSVTDWSGSGAAVNRSFKLSIDEPSLISKLYQAWKAQERSLVVDLSGQQLNDWISYRNRMSGVEVNSDDTSGRRVINSAFFSKGMIAYSTPIPRPAEAIQMLERFADAFDLTYTRFLDLKKAEDQAREAQIEAALEKVRSCSLAMHHSNELSEVVSVLFKKLGELGIALNGRAAIVMEFDPGTRNYIQWVASNVYSSILSIRTPYFDHPIQNDFWKARENGNDFFQKKYSTEDKNTGFAYLFEHTDFGKLSEAEKNWLMEAENYELITAFEKNSAVAIAGCTGQLLSENENEILRRFARVFEQAYIRFLDLQKAEAQAREAQIEAALERVRSRAMAMHSSSELSEVVHELRKQMGMLGQKDLDTCVIHLNETSPDYIDAWAAIRPPNSAGEILESTARVPKKGLLLIEEALEAYNQNRKDYVIINEGEKIRQWFSFIEKESPRTFDMILESTRDVTGDMLRAYWSFSDFPGGSLLMVTSDPPAESTRALLRRFANVFGLAYRRFADLMTAEAQAREARIETSLERLRTKTMAMKNSDDVGDTVATMFGEFIQLGIPTSRCGILIFDNEEDVEVWTARSNADGKATLIIGELNLHAHDLIESGYYCWKEKQSSQTYFLQGKDLINYYDALNRSDFYPVKFDLNNLPSEEFNSKFFFPDGAVFAFTTEPIGEDHAKIMGRFAGVFGQTYRRYLDLQKAEASAKEAIKQAALDRIRANIASMRTKQDLDRITPVIWNELTTLNIPFIRCGIFIINDDLQLIHTFLSNPEGKAIASFNLTYDSGKISDVVAHWRNNKNYVEHWKIGEFTGVADSLVQKGEIASREQYLQSLPPEGIYLHFVPFLQGMLYAGNLRRLSNDDISLLQAVADAFSTAYARYEDFNKVENTLNDLRQTQNQLVQAEKMASLGELTAGIAHEIQNPLNFVNNFSSLNTELVAEGLEAISSGNMGDTEDILKILAENSDKILQHGKRADAIVKGMLQHTRTSAGAKEPTDINALCDEYLKLAYHGLRAKDSTFNASLKTNFDKNVGKVNIIPQDIGRVLLNLINNAFYAVDEKKKQTGESYDPEVTVSTRMVNTSENSSPNESVNSLKISVKDNGNGIPRKIVDKIFQPFFTTKPTGQGTGLGLSLSYDIVKAHGGELKVETSEVEGTEFLIQLPHHI